MPRRAVPLIAGEYYHVYNRGNNRQQVFFERENYLYFLRQVRKRLQGGLASHSYEGQPACSVIAYCLMPNHYHLLVSPGVDEFSRHMQRLSISYAKAINKRHERVGALFQGKFQSVHVDRTEYLIHLSRYIHLNPVEAGLVEQPQEWEFSSYPEYMGLRQGTLPSPEIVLSQFADRGAYQVFVQSFHTGEQEVISHLLMDDR